MDKINLNDLEFWIGDMSKDDVLKDIVLPIVNNEYKPNQLKKDVLNTLQETDNMELK